jgi:predicted nucleic acid-binding protein
MSRSSDVVVVDSSALVELLLRGEGAGAAEHAVGTAQMTAPDVIDAETASALRRLERSGAITSKRAGQALADSIDSSILRLPVLSLMRDAWGLRENLSIYDALYVALARRLRCPLVTADHRLARAPRLGVAVIAI